MPLLKSSTAAEYISAWRKALPSQINDSFHQVACCRQERLLAFIMPDEVITELKNSPDKTISINYGYDAANAMNDAPAFKMLIRFEKSSKKKKFDKKICDCNKDVYKDYRFYELSPLSFSTIKDKLPSQISQNLLGGQPTHQPKGKAKPVYVNIETETQEFISPVFERYLLHAWQACSTSRLIDQVEALHNGERVRIETSNFDPAVTKLMLKTHKINGKGSITLIHMGLHQVIPGDNRIFHFGPVFQTYVPTSPVEQKKGKKDTSTHETQDTSFDTTNYELSIPCPPFCKPPDGDE